MIKTARKLILSSLIAVLGMFAFAAPAQANVLRDIQDVGVAVGVIPLGCATSDIIWAARCHASNVQYRMRKRRMQEERQAQVRPEVARPQTVRRAPIDPRIIAMVRDLENRCRSGSQAACRQLGAR